MNRWLYPLLALIVASCDSHDDVFRLEGRFKSFNQGELYIYSLDQYGSHKDTIRLNDGRFTYEARLKDSVAAYALIFPNYSEIPVFARPGVTVKVEGDASHLKETTVNGTDENGLLTGFRIKANDMTPPQVVQAAAAFIGKHPESPVSLYLLNKYFVQRPDPDYQQACKLIEKMVEATPTNERLQQLKRDLRQLQGVSVGGTLPVFAAVSTDGRKVDNSSLKADLGVVLCWASWNFDGLSMQRQLKTLRREYGKRLAVVGICLDAALKDCRDAMRRDSVDWPTVCDGKMWESPVVKTLAVTDVPGNLLVDRSGRVIARNITLSEMRDKIKEQLK